MPLHVAFLWHMHQPYYVDPVQGTALMPWVRLHATKGYLDMIWLADQFPDFHCTFNITPVLLKQIQQLANDEVRDLWHELAVPAPETLTLEQKAGILEHFFKANRDTMVKPFPRYWALLQKRGLNAMESNLEHVAASFSDEEFRDLQVWFNLTWFGYAAEQMCPAIIKLKRKGRGFSEEDKRIVFEQQRNVLKNLLGSYKALADRGQIEISTTRSFIRSCPWSTTPSSRAAACRAVNCRRRSRIQKTFGLSLRWRAISTRKSSARRRTVSGRRKVLFAPN